jgi:AraC family transcriptional regulator
MLKESNMKSAPLVKSTMRQAFRLPDAPLLTTRSINRAVLSVVEIKNDSPNFGMTDPVPNDDAHLIGLQMRDCPITEFWADGRMVNPSPIIAGRTHIYDHRRDPAVFMTSPFHTILFTLPRAAINKVTDDAEAPRIEDLIYKDGVGVEDPIYRLLIASLRPALANPQEACMLFVEHISWALTAHVASVYGGLKPAQPAHRGGLAPYQLRRAKELISANMNGEITLDLLAAECGLSVRHFARAFRQSTGVPPHRWLLMYRVEQAKELLRKPILSLSDVALSCGFADQSHFTRVFAAVVGTSPGAWRRMVMDSWREKKDYLTAVVTGQYSALVGSDFIEPVKQLSMALAG